SGRYEARRCGRSPGTAPPQRPSWLRRVRVNYTRPAERGPRPSGAPGKGDRHVGDGPGSEGEVHPPLVARRGEPRVPTEPRQQHPGPGCADEHDATPAGHVAARLKAPTRAHA